MNCVYSYSTSHSLHDVCTLYSVPFRVNSPLLTLLLVSGCSRFTNISEIALSDTPVCLPGTTHVVPVDMCVVCDIPCTVSSLFLTIEKYCADIKVEFTPFGAHAVAVCVSVTCSWSPVVCFEDDSRMLTVKEEDGKACVNVTRSMGDPDTFGYRAVDARVGTRATGTHS